MIPSLDDLLGAVLEGVENVGRAHEEPDDDWMPIVQAVSGDGHLFVIGLDGAFMQNNETKNALVEKVLKPFIHGSGAKQLALVFSTWFLEVPQGLDPVEDLPAPSEAPNRREAVLVYAMDESRLVNRMATIVRHENAPPTLGEWRADATTISGRFVEPLQAALSESPDRADPDFIRRMRSGVWGQGDAV